MPEARNTCDVETVQGLHDAFSDIDRSNSVLAGVLTGKGDYFCAGADLKELSTGDSIGFSWAADTRLLALQTQPRDAWVRPGVPDDRVRCSRSPECP
jgi:enoyl-CoA hydratase/carnithine racemase